jgi:lipoprotein-anchoring transpeptidase ErfK/SrfK
VAQSDAPDGAASRAGKVKSLLNVRRQLRFGEFVWNERGVPDGPIQVRADLKRQIVSVFRAGHEIGTSVILYGAPHKATPLGTFEILEKKKDYQSITYDAPMPFMLRLTKDGVAIHGSVVLRGRATHGCVGVPIEFAKRLFMRARKGDVVTIV